MASNSDSALSELSKLYEERDDLNKAKKLLIAEILFHKKQLQDAEIKLAANKAREEAILQPTAIEEPQKSLAASPRTPRNALDAMMAGWRKIQRSPLKQTATQPATKRRKTSGSIHASGPDRAAFWNDTDDEEDFVKVEKAQ